MKYISIDIETTGLDYDYCQVIEFAAIIDDLSWSNDIKRPAINFLVKHERYVCEPFAAGLHRSIWWRLANPDLMQEEKVALPNEVGCWLNRFCIRHEIDPMNIVAAGKNFAKFDLQFLTRLPAFNREVKFHHRILDPGMLYLEAFDETPPGTEACLERASIPHSSSHEALADAMDVIRLMRAHFLHDGLTNLECVVE
jgi:oligoribonuclease (3'-5' exoribonuclease)